MGITPEGRRTFLGLSVSLSEAEVLATIWPSRRTNAIAPAKRRTGIVLQVQLELFQTFHGGGGLGITIESASVAAMAAKVAP